MKENQDRIILNIFIFETGNRNEAVRILSEEETKLIM
jgi:hypothetical protein